MTKKVSRNAKCPCGSGKKYKRCCEGVFDWNDKRNYEPSIFFRHLSLNGKNHALLACILEALQFDNDTPVSIEEIKQACTPKAVREIHETIPIIWPDKKDFERICGELDPLTTGFFTGNYYPQSILDGVTRHTLYTDRILLAEPFMDPRKIKDKYSPVVNPAGHIENTLIGIRLVFNLWPWIESGLVNFIRTPDCFDLNLRLECYRLAENRLRNNPQLKDLMDTPEVYTDQFGGQYNEMTEWHFLSQPNQRHEELFREKYPSSTDESVAELLSELEDRRRRHPFYVPFIDENRIQTRHPFVASSTGGNYDLSKIVTALTNSHMITDLPYRWEELRIDHVEKDLAPKRWDSFAKALQESEFKLLNSVPLEAALELRKSDFLDNMRTFLSRLWSQTKQCDDFDDKNVQLFTDELHHNVNLAEEEWNNIDVSLRKWLFGGLAGAVGGAIVSGHPKLLLGGYAFSQMYTLLEAQFARKSFKKYRPAGFFLGLKKS